jgi:hypothetical protein
VGLALLLLYLLHPHNMYLNLAAASCVYIQVLIFNLPQLATLVAVPGL